MKLYRWLILLAALLLTTGEVLVFRIEASEGPRRQATAAAALADLASDTQSPGP
jgi:hypothetical protein